MISALSDIKLLYIYKKNVSWIPENSENTIAENRGISPVYKVEKLSLCTKQWRVSINCNVFIQYASVFRFADQ